MMAISLNPLTNYRDGVIRSIKSRKGDVSESGFIDRSGLYKIKGDSLTHFNIDEPLKIQGTEKIIQKIGPDLDFLGLEDPDIWIDNKTNLLHLYFTIAFRHKAKDLTYIYLGHAVGKNIDSLKMTEPVLSPDKEGNGAKEVSVAPINKQGFRYNLVESCVKEKNIYYSTIRLAIAKNMNGPWKFGKTIFHPGKNNIKWIAGHASPGPLFSKKFIDVGDGKLLGILNGREANKQINGAIKYGIFSVGIFIYDYEHGKIDWVSPQPFIRDPEAKTITFASQIVETKPGVAILYAHVDDSFIRAYRVTINKNNLI